MPIQALQRPDWHGTPRELGELFTLHKNRRPVKAVIFTHQLRWEVRLLIGAQLEVVQTQVCRTQEVLSTGRSGRRRWWDIADAMDKYGIKGTFFISTEQDPPPEERFFNQLQVWLLWPRMQKAVGNGREIGAHAVTHPCHRPQADRTSENYRAFCDANYNEAGSRDRGT